MAKLYFNNSEISQHQGLGEKLTKLVEAGVERQENQRSFRAFYDLEILGIAVYYRKNWHYNHLPQREDKEEKNIIS